MKLSHVARSALIVAVFFGLEKALGFYSPDEQDRLRIVRRRPRRRGKPL